MAAGGPWCCLVPVPENITRLIMLWKDKHEEENLKRMRKEPKASCHQEFKTKLGEGEFSFHSFPLSYIYDKDCLLAFKRRLALTEYLSEQRKLKYSCREYSSHTKL